LRGEFESLISKCHFHSKRGNVI